MTLKNVKNITTFSIIALFTLVSFSSSNIYAEEQDDYKMIGDVTPVLTFTFRDGIETHEFPVFTMGENLVNDSGVSFSVEGTVTHSPLLHKAMDEAYVYRYSNASFDHQFKYFDVDANFMKNGTSTVSFDYNTCRVDNYQVETLDSNDYESYFKDVGFAIVDKIDFVCSGLNPDNNLPAVTRGTVIDHGESGFKFANDVKTFVTFSSDGAKEKIQFPVFNLVSGYAESTRNIATEFSVDGILDYYPLLQSKIDTARKVSGLTAQSNDDFDVLVEFAKGEKTLRGFDFSSCRVSSAQITTQSDKEEGFTGKSGFATTYPMGFECSGINALNMYYDELRGDVSWKPTKIIHEYQEPLQNTDKGLSAFATFTFDDGIEIIEFSMFKQNEVLTVTEAVNQDNGNTSLAAEAFTRKVTYPTLELRGIVGDYPLLYRHVDENLSIQGIVGTNNRNLADIDIKIVSGDEEIRGFNYSNCRSTNYVVSTNPNTEESYIKNKFALESVFDFECQGYTPNNPVYDAMFSVSQANTESTKDLRNTDRWAPEFTMQK
jgi:hypothetical protein